MSTLTHTRTHTTMNSAFGGSGDQTRRLREALDELAHAAREFSTQADYTVERAVEDEFVAALATADEALANV